MGTHTRTRGCAIARARARIVAFPLGGAHFPDGSEHGALPVLLRVVFGRQPLVVCSLGGRACVEQGCVAGRPERICQLAEAGRGWRLPCTRPGAGGGVLEGESSDAYGRLVSTRGRRRAGGAAERTLRCR